MPKIILLVGVGSFTGGILRYLLSQFIASKWYGSFPLGTFAVNVVGCFVIGVVLGLADKESVGKEWKIFLVTGLCGGFTTFSAFSVETLTLMRQGQIGLGMTYALSSLIVGVAATWIGYAIFR